MLLYRSKVNRGREPSVVRKEGLVEGSEEKRGDSFEFSRDWVGVLRVPGIRSNEEGGWVPGSSIGVELITGEDRLSVDIFPDPSVHGIELCRVHGAPRSEAVVKSKF